MNERKISRKDLQKIFGDYNIPVLLNKDIFFESAVLIPLVKKGENFHLLFQTRADNIRQGGEISFPGGRMEKRDASQIETAIRETTEELGICREKIKIFGYLGAYLNPTGTLVHAVLGELKTNGTENLKINKKEVKEIFTVPLSFFLNNEPQKRFLNTFVIPEETGETLSFAETFGIDKLYDNKRAGAKYPVYFYEFGEKIIWGLTAFLVKYFIDRLKKIT